MLPHWLNYCVKTDIDLEDKYNKWLNTRWLIKHGKQQNARQVYSKKPVTVLAYLCSYIHTVLESKTLENCHCICNWKLTLQGSTKTSWSNRIAIHVVLNIWSTGNALHCIYKKQDKHQREYITCLSFHDSQQSFAKAIKLGLAENVLTNWSTLNELRVALFSWVLQLADGVSQIWRLIKNSQITCVAFPETLRRMSEV